ncbi:RNA polymerase sigma factor [uncultured Bacteroides sp.]|uniref:RNA polymerase sigma factor n=1 Tax=uncultured Bacteroides sp. TaxID=162156 RepID=UPI0025F327D3|nr:RNA polymerase sigma factor [uncultured Bacteroides sp.]
MKSFSFQNDLVGVQDELLRFAFKLTADPEEANDLLQETSLKAWDNKEKYAPKTNFKGWIFTIMYNVFVNNYRKLVREQTMINKQHHDYHIDLPYEYDNINIEKAYDLKEIHQIVNELPQEYKLPLMMYVSGFKYKEIAIKMDIPIGTVKSRIFFTRQILQKRLKDFR